MKMPVLGIKLVSSSVAFIELSSCQRFLVEGEIRFLRGNGSAMYIPYVVKPNSAGPWHFDWLVL